MLHHTRTACVLLGVALFVAALTAVTTSLISSNTDKIVVLSVGFVTSLVLLLWSYVQALRALATREPARLPGFLVILIASAITIPLSVIINAAYDYSTWPRSYETMIPDIFRCGLPLLLPVFVVYSLVAVPDAIRKRRALEPVPRSKGFRIYVACVIIPLVLLFPFILFVYCACPPIGADYLPQDWQIAVRNYMPNVVRDNSFRLLVNCSGGVRDQFIYNSLKQGTLSESVLKECVDNDKLRLRGYGEDEEGDPTPQDIAFQSLAKRYPDCAFDFALRMMSEPQERKFNVFFKAAEIIIERGTPDPSNTR